MTAATITRWTPAATPPDPGTYKTRTTRRVTEGRYYRRYCTQPVVRVFDGKGWIPEWEPGEGGEYAELHGNHATTKGDDHD
jgi:hypothetical protein